jgi:hypothetical protein
MTHHSCHTTIEHGLLQAAGMAKYAEASKGAPFTADVIRSDSEQLQALKLKQEALKAELHECTQKVARLEDELDKKTLRNVSYFMGVWGKDDKRLEEISGHALSAHHRHHTQTETQS